jgi:hypothetical protein
MQNNKRNFIEYLIYLAWSFITVTSFPFFLGSLIETYSKALPIIIVGFSWIVLLAIIIGKLKDKENPLYQMLTKHALVGGLTQLVTSLPAYLIITFEPDFDVFFSLDGIMVFWVLSSIVASISMSVYDIKLVKKIVKMYGISDQVKSHDVAAYLIATLFLTMILSVLMMGGSDISLDSIPYAVIISLVAGLYMLVIYQVVFALVQMNQNEMALNEENSEEFI